MQQEKSKSKKHNVLPSTSTSAIQQTTPSVMSQSPSTSDILPLDLEWPQPIYITSVIQETDCIPFPIPQPTPTPAVQPSMPLAVPHQASTSAVQQTEYHQAPGYNPHFVPDVKFTPHIFVICPLRHLPGQPCYWRGKQIQRDLHILESHNKSVVPQNIARLAPDSWEVMRAYGEYFLLCAITKSNPNKLYCVAKHICLSTPCVLTYQYRCEIRSNNGYEMTSDTRLAKHVEDNLDSLELSGSSARFDAETIKYFTDSYTIIVDFKVLLPKPL